MGRSISFVIFIIVCFVFFLCLSVRLFLSLDLFFNSVKKKRDKTIVIIHMRFNLQSIIGKKKILKNGVKFV